MRRVTIPLDVRRRLGRLARPRDDRLGPLFAMDCRRLARMCAVADWDPDRPARIVADYLDRLPGWPVADVRREAVALLALQFPANAPDFELPASVRAHYAPAFRRLAEFLDQEGAYDEDAFGKDVRFVLGLSAPVGAQDVDLAWRPDAVGAAGRLKRTTANLTRLALTGDVEGLRRFMESRPRRPWLQIHTDTRRLEDFHPDGWDQCYHRLAEIMDLHPEYAGLVGQSWFYDPAIPDISPRLAYLQARPMENGAVRIRLGANPEDVERATRTSTTRRRLHRAGVYQPRCWAIYWPRAALLDWARRNEAMSETGRAVA